MEVEFVLYQKKIISKQHWFWGCKSVSMKYAAQNIQTCLLSTQCTANKTSSSAANPSANIFIDERILSALYAAYLTPRVSR